LSLSDGADKANFDMIFQLWLVGVSKIMPYGEANSRANQKAVVIHSVWKKDKGEKK